MQATPPLVGKHNLKIRRGDTLSVTMILRDTVTKVPIDLTGCAFLAQVRTTKESANVVANLAIVLLTGVHTVAIAAQGSGYTSAPAVGFSGGGGSGAAATAVLGSGATAGKVVNIIVTNPGTGYTSAPTIALTGGAGSGAAVTASGGGHIDVRLEAADSVELPVAALPRGVWDLRVRFPDTTVQTMVEGDVELEWDVSR